MTKKGTKTIGAFKSQNGYEKNIARCGTCVYLRGGENLVLTQRGQRLILFCTLGEFYTKPYAICDRWRDSAGKTLEK